MENNTKLITGISIAAALVIFFLFFGGQSPFPKLYSLDLFFNQIGTSKRNISTDNINNMTNDNLLNNSGNLYVDGVKRVLDVGEFEESVKIQDVELGEGSEVLANSNVRLSYIGFLRDEITGKEIVFDENLSETVIFNLGVGQLIPGFEAGLVGTKEGGKRLIIIQPEVGYKDRSIGSIPANSVLHFIVEIHEVTN